MPLAAGFLSQADILGALDRDLDAPPRLLPPSVLAVQIRTNREQVAEWVYNHINSGITPAREETVSVSKDGHGIRPVSVWDLPTRLTYNCLVERLSPKLSRPSRTATDWRAFQKSPLEQLGTYIVGADIAACYQYIDHSLLAQELLAKTGDGAAVSAIVDLLHEVTGKRYGLPQQSGSSDILAEAFLNRLERACVRSGVRLSRYNDDFRINCDSWSDVIRSIEKLTDEARNLGLILNDAKLRTWGRATYQESLESSDNLRNEIAEEAELELTEFEFEYGGDVTVIEPDSDDIQLLTAIRILDKWQALAGDGRVVEEDRPTYQAVLNLLPIALAALSAVPVDAPGAISICMQLLRYEQTMTPRVCDFLSTRANKATLLDEFDSLISAGAYLTGWQAWWLQQPLAAIATLNDAPIGPRAAWLSDLFTTGESSPIIRANIALTMARHGLVTVEELLPIYDRSSPIVRPIIVAAIGSLNPAAQLRSAVIGDGGLNQWAIDATA